jgi:hypothetical protein
MYFAFFIVQSAWNTGRRVKLPAMEADTSGVNLWNLLCRNIGKDLSKISMPVTLNEPLSMLQRLCEELVMGSFTLTLLCLINEYIKLLSPLKFYRLAHF